MNFGCTVDTVDTVDTNFGVNCVNCVNCAPSSKRSPFAVAMHYQQRQRQQQQQQQQQEQREGIKTITTTNTHTQTAITILCPGASPALRSPSIISGNNLLLPFRNLGLAPSISASVLHQQCLDVKLAHVGGLLGTE